MDIKEVTSDTFEKEVLNESGKVLVDFWAPWCGHCRAMDPVVNEIAKEGHIKVCKINVDDEPGIASRFQVMSIPTFVVFNGRDIVNRAAGASDKNSIMGLIQS
ncbi:MAG: thioredoxin [Bacillota bacterium]|nr:thioredoxin [Bacillota bacterium]